MKRGIVALVFICILLSLSLVSANIFTDLWNKITGKAVYSSDISDCQLCRRYADSNNRANAIWQCVNFDGKELLTDFAGDVDGNDDFDFKVNCGNSEIKTGCKICRRFNDNCALGCVHNANWSCVNFDNTALLTDFTKDVNNYDYFDLKVECSVPEVASGCEICRKWADNNLRASTSWSCAKFDGTALNTDFVNNVNSNDDFDFKVNCNLGTAPQPGCTENWQCSDWSTCSNSIQTRTCTDANNCGTTANKPVTSQSCSMPCTDTCSSLGYNCGNQPVCGSSVNCGSCSSGYSCSNGKCVSSNATIRCSQNSDCGTSTSVKYCSGMSVCTNTTTYTCNNPGTTSSYCVSAGGGGCSSPCGYGCEDGACISVSEVDGCNLINQTIKAKIKELQTANMTVVLKEGERVYSGNYFVLSGNLLKLANIVNGSYNDYSVVLGSGGLGSLGYVVYIENGVGYLGIYPPAGGIVKEEYIIRYSIGNEYIILDFPQTAENERMTFYNCQISVGSCGFNINNKEYILELISATDTSASIKVSDSSGGSGISVISEGSTKLVDGIAVKVLEADEAVDRIVANLEVNGMYGMLLETGKGCEVEEIATCTDSDGGKKEYVFGTMTTVMGNASFEYSDQCVDNVVIYEGGGSYDEVNSCSGEKCYVREAFCKYDSGGRLIPDADNDELIKCQNGCVDGACLSKPEDECSVNTDENVCLDDVSCYWDQETSGCYKFDETKQLCSDPDDGENYEVRAHTFGFRKIYADERDKRIRTGGKDGCLPDGKLVEHYCTDDYYIEYTNYECPVRCDLGTCTEKPCEPRYYCKVEPAICPKSGIQTKQCSDFECDTDYYTEEVQCNPGECSGCELEGKCIPYGFRKKVTIYNNQQGDYKLYCDIDGELENQKPDWQECDNSYECDSNQCSGGECIGVIQMIQNTAKFKVAAIKFVCRLFNLLSPQDYQDCLAEFLGGGTSGGGGASA